MEESVLVRCIRCYNIVTPSLGADGNLVIFDLDNKHHACSKLNIIDESDKIISSSRLIDELFLQMIRTQFADSNTGELKRKYIEQARALLYRIPVFRPPPFFILYLSDMIDERIKLELISLSKPERNDVMLAAIGQVFECINEHQFNLSCRHLLRWKIEK